jgi:hypothetical protein
MILLPAFSMARAQQGARLPLGTLSTGAEVAFVRASSGEWGIDINGAGMPRISQPKPAHLEVFSKDGAGTNSKDDIRQLSAGYKSVEVAKGVATGRAELAYGSGVSFRVEDRWSVSGAVLSVSRRVEVTGSAPGGFDSAVMFSTQPEVSWKQIDFFAPGKLYADPTDDGAASLGGTLNYAAQRFSMRETYLTAPLFGLLFKNGYSVTVLDPSPRGNTTVEESRAPTGTTLIDEHYQFGALGANASADGGVEFGFWLPGTVHDYANAGGFGPAARNRNRPAPVPSVRRRYHPIKQGVQHAYNVEFLFGQKETFPELTRNSWRWAWGTLKPAVNYRDIPALRRMMIDFLADRIVTVDGRTGVPYLLNAVTGEYQIRSDARRAAMGFCARNIEIADELLQEADRDPGPRGKKLRKLGLDIISTFIRVLPMSPPKGDGFDIYTGKIIDYARSPGMMPILTFCTDMRTLTLAYRRELKLGREHPEWLRWITTYADWLLQQQRPDGSFPRSWKPGTNQIVDPSSSATFAPPILFVPLSEITGQQKYMDAAIRAGEFLWKAYGSKGVYVGGAVDASAFRVVTDKEGGMASLDAFMALYESTKQHKWLERAASAGDYAESWIWIWNIPLPQKDTIFPWRNGPMVGLQGITAGGGGGGVGGGGDEFLDWAVPLYVKLYKYTNDAHYLDVARILLHNTKAKLATPADTFGFLGPGWEQEGWGGDVPPDRVGVRDQVGLISGKGKWIPWVEANHLNGIIATDALDPVLFKQLSTKPKGLDSSGHSTVPSARRSN